MFYLLYCPTDLLFFNIPLLHYYIDHRSSIVCSLLSVNICLSFSFFLSPSIFYVSKLLRGEFLEVLSAALLRIKSPVASTVF